MELSNERRKATGAFYTPKIRADLAVKTMQEELGDLTQYVFYDPACGEGALLEALPAEVEKIGTTLEAEDVEICRQKGLRVDQLDFLAPEAEEFCINLANFYEIREKKLIIFSNPPFFKLKKEQYPEIKEQYGYWDSVALFYMRILDCIVPEYICSFNKIDIYQSSGFSAFRRETRRVENTKKLIMTRSKTWGLKGDFAIVFNIWEDSFLGYRQINEPIMADWYDGKESGTYKVWCH